MKELRDWLKDGDPVANEPPLSDADAQRMRRVIASVSEPDRASFADLARGSWAAATVVIALAIAIGMTTWSKPVPAQRSEDVRRQPRLLRKSRAPADKCS